MGRIHRQAFAISIVPLADPVIPFYDVKPQGAIGNWYPSRGVRLAHCAHRLTNKSVNCTLLLHTGVATVKRAETGVEPQKR